MTYCNYFVSYFIKPLNLIFSNVLMGGDGCMGTGNAVCVGDIIFRTGCFSFFKEI